MCKDLEGSTRNLPGHTEETHGNLSVAGVPVEIRTKHLQNMNLERYRYANPLRFVTTEYIR
jgi:hypothetical protein